VACGVWLWQKEHVLCLWQLVGFVMCEHESNEDCMFCCMCGQCREDLDSNDICMDCGGVDENEEDCEDDFDRIDYIKVGGIRYWRD